MKKEHVTVLLFLATLSIAGCATSSGVMQLGPDTYKINAMASPARGGLSGAQQMALSEASAHCQKMNKQILVQNISTQMVNNFGAGAADFIFMCLNANDPQLHRPDFDHRPDVVIENRNK